MPEAIIRREDYLTYIRDKNLTMIIEDNEGALFDAESTALSIVKDYIYPYYDADTIFKELDKYRSIKRWIIVLVMYYIYERIPDRLVPDRIVKNYDDVLGALSKISAGKMSVFLPVLKEQPDQDGDGEPDENTKFRWGSNPRRYH